MSSLKRKIEVKLAFEIEMMRSAGATAHTINLAYHKATGYLQCAYDMLIIEEWEFDDYLHLLESEWENALQNFAMMSLDADA